MSHTDRLGRIPLLSGLSPAELEAISKLTEARRFPENSEMIRAGEEADALFLLLAGSVQVLAPAPDREIPLARLGPGDCVGEMALLNQEPRSATVRTLEPVEALVLPREAFRNLLRSSADVALNLLEVLSRRIRNADEQMAGLSDQALRDPLTNLLNRRAFQERIADEANRNQRYGDRFSLLLLDLDRFKAVNDTLGHDAGDRVLAWVAERLVAHTRAADTPFRIGGEEFAILAPAAGPDVARNIAERMRRTIEEGAPPGAEGLRITVSAGYASCPEHGRHPESLQKLADEALYRAKREGRNRVGDPEPDPAS